MNQYYSLFTIHYSFPRRSVLALCFAFAVAAGCASVARAATDDPLRELDQSVARFMARSIIRQYRARFHRSMIDETALSHALLADTRTHHLPFTNMWRLYPDARRATILSYYDNVWEALRFMEESRPADLESWFSRDAILADALITDEEADAALTNQFPEAYSAARALAVQRQIAQLWPTAQEMETETMEGLRQRMQSRFTRTPPLQEVEMAWDQESWASLHRAAEGQFTHQWQAMKNVTISRATTVSQIENALRRSVEEYRSRLQNDESVRKVFEIFPRVERQIPVRARELFVALMFDIPKEEISLPHVQEEVADMLHASPRLHASPSSSWERVVSMYYTSLVARVVDAHARVLGRRDTEEARESFEAFREMPEMYADIQARVRDSQFAQDVAAARARVRDEQAVWFTPVMSHAWQFDEDVIARAYAEGNGGAPSAFLALPGIADTAFEEEDLLYETREVVSNVVGDILREGMRAMEAQERLVGWAEDVVRRQVRLYPYSVDPRRFYPDMMSLVSDTWATGRVDAVWRQFTYIEDEVEHAMYRVPPNYMTKYAALFAATTAAVVQADLALQAYHVQAVSNAPVLAVTIGGDRYVMTCDVRWRDVTRTLTLRNPDLRNRPGMAQLRAELEEIVREWVSPQPREEAVRERQVVLLVENVLIPYNVVLTVREVIEETVARVGRGQVVLDVEEARSDARDARDASRE